MVSICPILNDTHFDSLDKLASAKFLHSKVIWSTFVHYKYLGGGLGGEWIHVYVWLSPLAVHLKLSQHC